MQKTKTTHGTTHKPFQMPFCRGCKMKNSRYPFSVFKRKGRPCYMVAFKNETTGQYLPAISTKQTTESEAIKTAWQWLRDGIPQKDGGALPSEKLSFRAVLKNTPPKL